MMTFSYQNIMQFLNEETIHLQEIKCKIKMKFESLYYSVNRIMRDQKENLKTSFHYEINNLYE